MELPVTKKAVKSYMTANHFYKYRHKGDVGKNISRYPYFMIDTV